MKTFRTRGGGVDIVRDLPRRKQPLRHPRSGLDRRYQGHVKRLRPPRHGHRRWIAKNSVGPCPMASTQNGPVVTPDRPFPFSLVHRLNQMDYLIIFSVWKPVRSARHL